MPGTVSVVVCMDTEGPCADPDNPELLASWSQVDAAMDKLFSTAFRQRRPDPFGGVLRIGWFFLTWTGFRTNPRGRDFGYHAVRDHYLARWGAALQGLGDEECWHYHHPPASGIGNEWGIDWAASSEYEAIVSRQVLERAWFPACFRAGGTILTPESSRWVDAWFPIDFSNRAPLHLPGLVDWRTGVAEWAVYHPSPEDFRRPGSGRRHLARCLDLVTGVHALTEQDVVAAFERAAGGRNAILSVFEHDYRDIEPRLDGFRDLLAAVGARFPEVPWRYDAPRAALRRYLGAPRQPALLLEATTGREGVLVSSSGAIHQSVPWLAVRTAAGAVRHIEDGLLRLDETHWRWQPSPDLDWEEAAFGASTGLGEEAVTTVARGDAPFAGFLHGTVALDPQHPRSIWQHSKLFIELSVERSSGATPETDAVGQALDLLGGRLEPGMSLLDAGCAGGYLARSLAGSGVDYSGIDSSPRAIEVARALLAGAGVTRDRLRAVAIEDLPPDELYDAVVCLNMLHFQPMFHPPLEALARAARRWLVVRASFGDELELRYLPDALLEPPFQSLRTHFNIYPRDAVERFLEAEGFRVEWHDDARQRERFAGRPEVVGGVPIPYGFLLAERIAASPAEATILGESLSAIARDWLARREFPR